MQNLFEIDNSYSQKRDYKHKKVCLIAAPWIYDDVTEFRSQQLGLGYIGAYAEKFGHDIVSFIDPMLDGGEYIKKPIRVRGRIAYRFGYSDEHIVKKIPKNVDVIGINAPFTDSRLVVYPLIYKLKETLPKVKIVVGGVLATTLPEQILNDTPADIVVRGEGEIAFSRILNDEPIEKIPGLVYRNNDGSISRTEGFAQQFRNIDILPSPGYNLRKIDKYINWSPRGDKSRRTLSLVSSRGCPFSCQFCSIPEKGQQWRPFSSERMIKEIDWAIERFGVNHFEFEDDNFGLNQGRAIKILKHISRLRKRGMKIECSFPNGLMIYSLNKDIVFLLKEAGVDIAYLPLESGDQHILVSMNKYQADTHLQKTKEVAGYCAEAGLFVSCFVIIAYPGGNIKGYRSLKSEWEPYVFESEGEIYLKGEDEASFERTMSYCKSLKKIGVNGITPLIATPYPGTELYKICKKFQWLVYEDDCDVLTTTSYAHMKPEYVLINTPWCSRKEAFQRWNYAADIFSTYHNIRRYRGDKGFIDTRYVSRKESS